jgi:hypothetical protein
MMGIKERQFAPLGPRSLEDLVAADHFYRHLDRTRDLSFRRSASSSTAPIPPLHVPRLCAQSTVYRE